MNADFSWAYMVAVLSGNLKSIDEAQAAVQANETARYLAQDVGLVSKTGRIHRAVEAK
jgi:hypothetical protein